MELLSSIRKYMKENKIDYLLINSTNEFLVEYPKQEENARYYLTGFTGDTGDALVTEDKVFLFVDGRFYEQADKEANKTTTVVKMPITQNFIDALFEKVDSNKTFTMLSTKNSENRYELIKKILKLKNTKVKLIDKDIVFEIIGNQTKSQDDFSKIEFINEEIAGFTPEKKLAIIRRDLPITSAYLFTNLEEVSYLCNLRDFSINYSTKIAGKCIVSSNNAILFTNSKVKDFSKSFNIRPLKEFTSFVKDTKGINTYLIDKTSINAFDYSIIKSNSKVKTIKNSPLKLMKAVKTISEIEHLKECFKRTDKAVMATREYFLNNDNISEFDVCKKLEENFYKYGAKSLSFKSIVAKDENSALAHYSENSKTAFIKDGSTLLIDCGAYYEGGLATDSTRVFVKGSASNLQKEVYTKVLKAYLKAYNKKISQNTTGFQIDNTARKLLAEIAPKGFSFSHGLGHGIGINVHEAPPNLSVHKLAKTKLFPNMCFTIEPGLYKAGKFGIRLENSCYLSNVNNELKIKSFSNICFEKALINFDLLTKTEKKQLKEFEVI